MFLKFIFPWKYVWGKKKYEKKYSCIALISIDIAAYEPRLYNTKEYEEDMLNDDENMI